MPGEQLQAASVAVTNNAPKPPRANKDAESAAAASLSRRNPAVINAISAQLALGLTHQQIADAIGLERSTVTKIIGDYMPTMDVARKRLEGAALGASEDWVRASRRAAKDGNHKPAKELLQAIGVVQQDASSITQAVVFVADGDTPIGPRPTFASEVSAVTLDMHRLSGDLGSDNGDYVVNQLSGAPAVLAAVDGGVPSGARSALGPPTVSGGGMEPENFPSETGTA